MHENNYPSVYHIGMDLSEAEFRQQRISAAGWVHVPRLVDQLLRGDYFAIKPLHIELCFYIPVQLFLSVV